MLQRTAALLLVLGTAQAGDVAVTFTDCCKTLGNCKGTIKTITNPGTCPTPGDCKLGGAGTLDETATAATMELTLKLKGIQIFDKKSDACGPFSISLPLGLGTVAVTALASCPAQPGAVTVSIDVDNKIAIPGEITAHSITTDQAGNNLLCFDIDFKPSATAAVAVRDPLEDPSELVRIAATVNAAQTSWVADPAASGRFANLKHVQSLCGTYLKGHPQHKDAELAVYTGSNDTALPTSFDARTQWSKCTVIGKVRNQAGCGSCWAFGATESFEGRRCAKTGNNVEFSAGDTAACSSFFGNGCGGGNPGAAAEWFTRTGVVTGGEYHEDNGCVPYECPPCKKGLYPPDCETNECGSTLKCEKSHGCTNTNYNKTYSEDKTKAVKAISVRGVENIQKALMTDGPLAVAFTVYGDFPTYKSGVYSHTSGSALGGHAVVLIGWGTEGGEDYWLIKNSWSDQWGDKGLFKIKRGTNECGIEDEVSGNTF